MAKTVILGQRTLLCLCFCFTLLNANYPLKTPKSVPVTLSASLNWGCYNWIRLWISTSYHPISKLKMIPLNLYKPPGPLRILMKLLPRLQNVHLNVAVKCPPPTYSICLPCKMYSKIHLCLTAKEWIFYMVIVVHIKHKGSVCIFLLVKAEYNVFTLY